MEDEVVFYRVGRQTPTLPFDVDNCMILPCRSESSASLIPIKSTHLRRHNTTTTVCLLMDLLSLDVSLLQHPSGDKQEYGDN